MYMGCRNDTRQGLHAFIRAPKSPHDNFILALIRVAPLLINCTLHSCLKSHFLPTGVPEEVAHENANLVLVTTRSGGHMGFLQGLLPFRKNYMDTVLVQFLTAVLQHKCFETSTTDDVIESDQDTCVLHTLL